MQLSYRDTKGMWHWYTEHSTPQPHYQGFTDATTLQGNSDNSTVKKNFIRQISLCN